MGSVPDLSGDSDPLYVFYHYHSAPIERIEFGCLLSNLAMDVGRPITKLFFFCDVRIAPVDFVDDVEAIPNSDIIHIFYRSRDQFEGVVKEKMMEICERMKGTAVVYCNGDSLKSTLEDLADAGWTTRLLNVPSHGDNPPQQRNMSMPPAPIHPSMIRARTPVQNTSQLLPKYTARKTINRKCTPQCPQWEDKVHSEDVFCPLFHPEKPCMFYPMCRNGAENCMFAHPFCRNGGCQCDGSDLQLNHFMAD